MKKLSICKYKAVQLFKPLPQNINYDKETYSKYLLLKDLKNSIPVTVGIFGIPCALASLYSWVGGMQNYAELFAGSCLGFVMTGMGAGLALSSNQLFQKYLLLKYTEPKTQAEKQK